MTLRSLWLLLKKNLIVEKRSYLKTLLEYLITLSIFLVLIIFHVTRKDTLKTLFQNEIKLDDLSLFRKLMDLNESTIPYKLYFTPNSTHTQELFEKVAKTLELNGSKGFTNENEMIQAFMPSSVFAAVVLEPHNLTLRFPNYFRTRPYKNYYRTQDFWLTKCFGFLDDEDYYAREGFLPLLYTIVSTQIEMKSNKSFVKPKSFSSMNFTTLPRIECVNDFGRKLMTSERFFNWSLYYFIYFVPFLNLVWKFAREHEENIFVHHRIYGFVYNDHRFAHFIVSLLHLIVLDVLVFTFLTYIWPPLPQEKSLLLFAFLVIFTTILIVYAMTLATFWVNAKTCLWFAVALWITSYAVFAELLNTTNFDIFKTEILIISVIFFNNLLPNSLLDYFETDESQTISDIINLFGVLFLMLIIYGCLLKSLDFYKPGRYIKILHRSGTIKNTRKVKSDYLNTKPNIYKNNIEYGPLNQTVLELQNISSIDKCPKLNNISMRFFKNEISVLLGPHCSGKTSLISILAGWQHYRGQIIYQSQYMSKKFLNNRENFDVSMPNNNLFDLLTLKETLQYFILLKRPKDTEFQLDAELKKWLNILKPNMAHGQQLVKTLTFGEKRLLVLCCTLVCNTRVILLDEPTLHMRAEEQNKYWDILKKEKQNRVIVITTISIDEAADIGDRIGILNEGNLIAWGSSYYLRNKFAKGIYLVCFIQPMKPITAITQLLQNYITNVKLQNHFVDRAIYILPPEHKPIFQRLLIDLEKDFTKLGITHIYMTGSSLNDVYMALTHKQDAKKNHIPDIKNNLKFVREKKTKPKKYFMRAIFYKKLCQQAKNILPICIIFIACFLILAFDQICSASLNIDRIIVNREDPIEENMTWAKYKQKYTFWNIGEHEDSPEVTVNDVNKTYKLAAFLNSANANIGNGLFNYKYVHYSSDSYDKQLTVNSLAVIDIDKAEKNVRYNHGIFHSTILALHLTFGNWIRGIIFTNKPIILQGNHNLHITLGTIMPLTMSIVFVILQEERFNSMQTLQRLAGINDCRKWILTFLWDFLIYILISLLYFLIIITCVLHFITGALIMAVVLLFFLSGLASILFMYIMFLIIKEENKCRAYIKIFSIQLILGLFFYILYINIFLYNFNYIYYIFMISPGFSILHGMNRILNNFENPYFASYFKWQNPGILDSICFILITTLIYLIIFVVIIFCRNKYRRLISKKTMASVCYPYDDDRVIKEKVRISNMNIKACRSQAILVDQLDSKLPKSGRRISGISFALNKYSCLGIYGTNHAEKSLLLKQLVGEKSYVFGDVYIAGFYHKNEMTKALKHLGYCPQTKGFNSLLTPRELLTFFLMLNGVTKSKRFDQICDLSATLKLRNYMNTRMADIPFNIKRRVNIAVALIASREILIIDEPTKGLPAYDRLLIWKIIKYYRSLGNTIIFTTTESLELKELSDVVIAVNDGEMLVYDNAHNMEFQYNVGFYMEIKLYADGLTLKEVEENLNTDVENLNRFIMFFHEESELLYCNGYMVKYYIPVENVIYSYIFGTIEKYRYRVNISDYTLTPFSLNNILRLLQKSRKEKKRLKRSNANLLKDAKILPKRD